MFLERPTCLRTSSFVRPFASLPSKVALSATVRHDLSIVWLRRCRSRGQGPSTRGTKMMRQGWRCWDLLKSSARAHPTVASTPQVRPVTLRLQSSLPLRSSTGLNHRSRCSRCQVNFGVSLLFTSVDTCCAPYGLFLGSCSVTFECPPRPL